MPPQKRGQRSADFAERHLELPPVRSGAAFDDFAGAGRRASPPQPIHLHSADDDGNRRRATRSPTTPPIPIRPPPRLAALRPSMRRESFAPPAYASPPTPQPQRRRFRRRRRAASPAGAAQGSAEALLRGIAAGAGVSPNVFLQRDQADVAAEIGAVLRTMVEELAILLKARAAAKLMAKSGNRTMISAVDNNPLKFVPRPEEVLEIMFTRRAGYLDAKRSVDEAFHDLKTHEFATYAAMQKALSRLLEDLSPEAIEKKVAELRLRFEERPRLGDVCRDLGSQGEAARERHARRLPCLFQRRLRKGVEAEVKFLTGHGRAIDWPTARSCSWPSCSREFMEAPSLLVLDQKGRDAVEPRASSSAVQLADKDRRRAGRRSGTAPPSRRAAWPPGNA